jgi:hypothetical protein
MNIEQVNVIIVQDNNTCNKGILFSTTIFEQTSTAHSNVVVFLAGV